MSTPTTFHTDFAMSPDGALDAPIFEAGSVLFRYPWAPLAERSAFFCGLQSIPTPSLEPNCDGSGDDDDRSVDDSKSHGSGTEQASADTGSNSSNDNSARRSSASHRSVSSVSIKDNGRVGGEDKTPEIARRDSNTRVIGTEIRGCSTPGSSYGESTACDDDGNKRLVGNTGRSNSAAVKWLSNLLAAVLALIGPTLADATITNPLVPAATATDAGNDSTPAASGDESSSTSSHICADANSHASDDSNSTTNAQATDDENDDCSNTASTKTTADASDDGSSTASTQTTADPSDTNLAIPLPSATAAALEFSLRAINYLEDNSPWSPLPVESNVMTEVLTMVDAYDLEDVLRATVKAVDASKSVNVVTRTDNSSTDTTDPFVLFLGAAILRDTVALDRLAEIILDQPKENMPLWIGKLLDALRPASSAQLAKLYPVAHTTIDLESFYTNATTLASDACQCGHPGGFRQFARKKIDLVCRLLGYGATIHDSIGHTHKCQVCVEVIREVIAEARAISVASTSYVVKRHRHLAWA